jgi:hypothetical protein
VGTEPAARAPRWQRMETFDPHKSTNEVRQGSPRMMNMRVLIISLLLIVVLFGILYFFFNQPPATGG